MTRNEYIEARDSIRAELRGLAEQALYTKTRCRRGRRTVETISQAVQWGVELPGAQREAAKLKEQIRWLHENWIFIQFDRMEARRREAAAAKDEAAYGLPTDAIDDHNFAMG